MSVDATTAITKQPLGTSLWLLIGMMLWAGLSDLVGVTFLWMVEDRYPAYMQAGNLWNFSGVIVEGLLHAACFLSAALALALWRRRTALYLASVLIWVAAFLPIGEGVVAGDFTSDLMANLGRAANIAMAKGLFAACGCTAFLLATPRLRMVYPKSRAAALVARPSLVASPAKVMSYGRLVLVIFLVLPVGRLTWSIATAPQQAGGPDAAPWLTQFIEQQLAPAGFAIMMLCAAGWFWYRRRWSGVTMLIAFLWLLPIGSRILAISTLRESAGTQLKVIAGLAGGAGFTLLAAMAWTAYLMESPAIHRLYPGHRRRNDLVTDVDAF